MIPRPSYETVFKNFDFRLNMNRLMPVLNENSPFTLTDNLLATSGMAGDLLFFETARKYNYGGRPTSILTNPTRKSQNG